MSLFEGDVIVYLEILPKKNRKILENLQNKLLKPMNDLGKSETCKLKY